VICPSPVTDYLARQALSVREQILERTRDILNTNYPIFDEWLGQFDEVFEWQRPDCGAICFVRYRHPVSALDLVERIRNELSILLVPGEHFALPRHLRFGFGNELDELEIALRELKPALIRLLQ
jgi:DNA-binding transcriptional MocR family regulator